MKSTFRQAFLVILGASFAIAALAGGFSGEIMTLQGNATLTPERHATITLSKGHLVSLRDTLETGPKSFVDVGFDRDWKNVIRVGENTKIRVDNVYPIDLTLTIGQVLARLDAIPENSTFEVKTPTSITGIRGSACLIKYDGATTEVQNFHEHLVQVFATTDGQIVSNTPFVMIGQYETASVKAGKEPLKRAMTADEITVLKDTFAGFDNSIAEVRTEGPSDQLNEVPSVADTGTGNHDAQEHRTHSTLTDRESPRGEDQRADNPAGRGGDGSSGDSATDGIQKELHAEEAAI